MPERVEADRFPLPGIEDSAGDYDFAGPRCICDARRDVDRTPEIVAVPSQHRSRVHSGVKSPQSPILGLEHHFQGEFEGRSRFGEVDQGSIPQ